MSVCLLEKLGQNGWPEKVIKGKIIFIVIFFFFFVILWDKIKTGNNLKLKKDDQLTASGD